MLTIKKEKSQINSLSSPCKNLEKEEANIPKASSGKKYCLPTDTHCSYLPTLTLFSLAEPIHFQAANQDESRSVVDNPIICLVQIWIFAALLAARNSYVI